MIEVIPHLSSFQKIFNDGSFIHRNHVLKRYLGKWWLKIFYHNTALNNSLFKNSTEALHCNTIDKYSVLDELELPKYKNGYTFLLEYPEVDANEYNLWYQTQNPTKISSRATPVEGFNATHLGWSGREFAGLSLSLGNTFLRGTSLAPEEQYWHYAIGAYNNWPSEYYFPGQGGVRYVNLWVEATSEDKQSLLFSLKRMKIKLPNYRKMVLLLALHLVCALV